MSNWNYRVVHRVDVYPTGDDESHEDVFYLIEAYYADDGTLTGWHPEVQPVGTEVAALGTDLVRMMEALEKPVIEESDLPKR